ncbi:MAG TPA: TrkH family potassium uptake protein [Bacteroidetes bacterium]|nr:TrkH family potassium uptake protein [Bacteroidota bacterium]
MRIPLIIRHIGGILLFTSLFLFIALIFSLIDRDGTSLIFLYCTILCLIFGLFPMIFVPTSTLAINIREGIAIVVAGWFVVCLFGSLPYLLWGGEFSLVNAWFESVSGYTTTGSSILNDVEGLPRSLLFWRSSTHWIGGLGVILFTLIILPGKDSSKFVLVSTELSEIARQNFRESSKRTLHILFFVYLCLTLAETILLKVCGMSLFDAVNHAFATIATGGFSTRNLSISHFNSIRIETVIMLFMVLSGINFGLLFGTVTLQNRNIFTSSIVRWFILVLFTGIMLVTASLYASGYGSLWHSLRYASFQVLSLGTTTGFATTDTGNWPVFTQLILIYFTLQCACIGSTSGGLKFDRIIIFFKSLNKQLRLIRHPKAAVVCKLENRPVSEQLENQTLVFTVLYLLIILISTLALTVMDVDLMTSFSGVTATIGNVGPGFGEVSSLSNYSGLPAGAKILLSLDMLIGRLEIFNILIFFSLKNF